MNYLEIKVKELFEQVLRGEKRVPKLETHTNLSWSGKPITTCSMEFSGRLTIKYDVGLAVNILDKNMLSKTIRLFDEPCRENVLLDIDKMSEHLKIKENTKLKEEKIELERLFKKVWEYSKNIKNDNELLVDEVFGELE